MSLSGSIKESFGNCLLFLGKQILHLCTMHLYYLESDGYFKAWWSYNLTIH